MTTTLTHPPAEDLGCFIEGTLDDEARAAVVEHLADCDDCRITVVDATAFADPAAFDEDLIVKQRPAAGGRWWAAAAAAIAIAVGGLWLVDARRDPLAPVMEASSRLSSRLVAARLSGFPYVVRKGATRGSGGDTDFAASEVEAKAYEVLQRRGDDSRMLHAKGVAGLLAVEAALVDRDYSEKSDQAAKDQQDLRSNRDTAINQLRSAANTSNNAAYLSDLAAALMAKGDRQSLEQALAACNRALQIDPRSADARFNRAKALDLMAQTPSEQADVIKAYNSYLEVDPSSPWAKEAHDRIDTLREELKPLP